MYVFIQRGNEALAGQEEINIPSYRFPLDKTKDRTIYFKGRYLSIINQETSNKKTYKDNTIPTTEYIEYEIPARYTCYIRVASIYFIQY